MDPLHEVSPARNATTPGNWHSPAMFPPLMPTGSAGTTRTEAASTNGNHTPKRHHYDVPLDGARGILVIVGRGRGKVVIALAIVACHASQAPASDTGGASTSASASTSGTTSDGTSTSADSSTSAAIEDGPPVVVDIGKTASFVGPGDRVTMTAFVHHPRGEQAVVAGVLVGPGDPPQYGAFVRGVNGRWSIDVGWDDVDERIDLSFEDELVIEFVARFVDDVGREAEAAIELPHQCTPLAPTACDGECADVDISAIHCGGCDQPCEEQEVRFGFPAGGCDAGTCAPLWSACIAPADASSCTAACGALGSSCAPSGCFGQTVMPVLEEAGCGDVIEAGGVADPDTCDAVIPEPFARCCCTQ